MAAIQEKDLAQFLKSPAAEDYLQKRKELERKALLRKKEFPLWTLGALAGGGGLYGLGSWILRPEDAKNLQQLTAMTSMVNGEKALDDWKNPTEFYTQYLDRAGRAARAKLFGGRVSGRDAMVFYRKNIIPILGGEHAITNAADQASANEHYDTFASGPLLSHLHMLKWLSGVKKHNMSPESQKSLLREEAQRLSEQTGLKPERLLDLKTPISPSEASYADQLQAVRSVLHQHSKQPDSMVAKLVPDMAEKTTAAVGGYAPLNALIQGAHQIPRAVGLGLAGLGLAGLGGWGAYRLYNWLRKGKQDRAQARAIAQARREAAQAYTEQSEPLTAESRPAAVLKAAHALMKFAGGPALGKNTLPEAKPALVTTTVPVGLEWDWPGQESEYQQIIKSTRPELSAHLIRGHGGGPSSNFVVRPRSRGATDPESLLLNAKNTRAIPEILRTVKKVHEGVPDLLYIGQCNKQKANIPCLIEEALGKKPSRLVYTAPGAYSNTGVSREALKFVLQGKRPLLIPTEKEFRSGEVGVRGLIQPIVPTSLSIPALSGGAAMLVNEIVQRRRKQPNSWARRLTAGAGGALLGALGLALVKGHERARAHSSTEAPNFEDPTTQAQIPVVSPA